MLFYYGILFLRIYGNFSCFIMYYITLFCLWITNISYYFKELVTMFRAEYFICCVFNFFFVYLFLFSFYGFLYIVSFLLGFFSSSFSKFLEFSFLNITSFCSLDRDSILSLYLYITLTHYTLYITLL